jgi:hypothetical protein
MMVKLVSYKRCQQSSMMRRAPRHNAGLVEHGSMQPAAEGLSSLLIDKENVRVTKLTAALLYLLVGLPVLLCWQRAAAACCAWLLVLLLLWEPCCCCQCGTPSILSLIQSIYHLV